MPFDLKNSSPFNIESTRANVSEKQVSHAEPQPSQNQEIPQQEKPASKVLHKWNAPEFEVYEKTTRWYIIFALFIMLMVIYALYTNAPIVAITFILIGIVGYIHLQKDPRVVTFSITSKGVIADRELYLYENIHSFWIFYDENHTKTISLHTKASMLPFVHIPIADEDPVKLRELLIENIPEIKQDPSLIDAIERVLHI
jgi:hypothetical protein